MNFSVGRSKTINTRQRPGCLIGFALFWIAFSSIFLIIGINEREIVPQIIGGLFVLTGLIFLGYALLTAFVRRQIGKPEFLISKDTLKVGEPFTVSLFHTFKSGAAIDHILIQLYLQETATYQQGTDTRTVRHKTTITEFEEPGGNFHAGHMIQNNYDMQIPADSMHTLKVRRNQIQWFVKFQMAIPRLPDFVNEYELDVLPALYQE